MECIIYITRPLFINILIFMTVFVSCFFGCDEEVVEMRKHTDHPSGIVRNILGKKCVDLMQLPLEG